MLNIERENSILELLKQKETIKIQEIVDLLNISEATARRDLASLEKKELLKRVHGGAILNNSSDTTKDFNIQFRRSLNRGEKEKIAEFAASFIKRDSCIFLDAGTTTLCMIKYLKNLNVKVVTNGLNLIDELEKYNIESFLVGGKIKSKTSCTVGFSAVQYLKTFNFQYAFIGVNALNLDGYSTPDFEEALIKSEAINKGEKVFFLCDHSKIGKSSFTIFSTLDKGTLITDQPLSKEYTNLLKVEVVK
ncbi:MULTISPECIES: DeoR/GlpR family DNA-binding transcription regulator [Cetobacterium]|jgi:DeoR family fructose operon transcriptional repressor|uniref:DeoR/GlpR family DNA-binding transcription regulator n=1 Tax=Candidatus Cetobacterium colombiensis TaxID=3073100 RepID=A0ABU4WA41_9FUSO|nr:DeoR/GlpR family DNA-binding transcription regulator [Candidatus Cetobacterium colombiensis]MDX8336404.1 DeoR/GlpR family DNA-binding transcription regulator [Candidatus Cetobacterium colombiensis]